MKIAPRMLSNFNDDDERLAVLIYTYGPNLEIAGGYADHKAEAILAYFCKPIIDVKCVKLLLKSGYQL